MAYTVTVGAEFSAGVGVAQSPTLPSGTLTGKLLILVTTSSTSANTPPSTPSGYTILGDIGASDPLIVYGKIAGASESAPSLGAWTSGASCGFMLAIASDTGAWPAIGSILQGGGTNPDPYAPASGTTACYAGIDVQANGNCILRIGEKNGTFSGTPTDIALTSGYTAAGFANGTNCACWGEMLTAVSTASSDPTDISTVTVTGENGSTNRSALTFEFVPLASITISVDDSTPSPTQAIVITKSGGNWTGTPTATLGGVAMPALTSVSGAVATLTLGKDTLDAQASLDNYDDNNATWELIRWNTALDLVVTDSGAVSNAVSITIQPPVTDHFDTLGASGIYVTSPGGSGDDSYVHIVSGDGEGLPIIADLQGSTVPTVARFMCFDVSGGKWLAYNEQTFDVASAAMNGGYADAFTGADSTAITSHNPDSDVVGTGYRIEKDVSTAAAVSNSVDIQSNRVRINDANEGFVIDVGTNEPDFSFDWYIEPAASGRQFVAQVRRKDDTEHVHVYVKQNDGLIRVNERVASANIGVTGDNETYYGAFAASATYRFRIYVVGNVVQVYVDDVLQIEVTCNRDADSTATDVGIFAAGASTYPVYFDNANCYTDYTGARTITFSDSTPSPGDTITLTASSAFAGTINSVTVDGVSFAPSAADLDSCTITIPDYDQFDAAGSMVNLLWNRNLTVVMGDGVATATSTLQIVPDVSANFAELGNGPYANAPAGTKSGDEGYVHVVSGNGTAYPLALNFSPSENSVVRYLVADTLSQSWLASILSTYSYRTSGTVVKTPIVAVVRSAKITSVE